MIMSRFRVDKIIKTGFDQVQQVHNTCYNNALPIQGLIQSVLMTLKRMQRNIESISLIHFSSERYIVN